jgi:hypothetical protein
MENIEDLRKVLFETIKDVKDGKMPLDKAKAIQDVAQVIVNSAKVVVDYLRATGKTKGTGFIPMNESRTEQKQLPDSGQGYTGKLNPGRR